MPEQIKSKALKVRKLMLWIILVVAVVLAVLIWLYFEVRIEKLRGL